MVFGCDRVLTALIQHEGTAKDFQGGQASSQPASSAIGAQTTLDLRTDLS